jgi:hypothetical protein|tara:strand:+ start:468 stop:872 length:405 start_codon:yes stop_codon:yes gene_type:complete
MTEKVVETQAEYTSGTIYIDPGTSSVLVCPICVGEKHKPNMNLHQGTVEVYIRGKEDSLSGTHVLVEESNNENMGKGAIFADHDVEDGNPSVRRDGLKIAFRCEYHDDPLMLNIFQHKGITYFQWDNTDEERED